MIAQIADVVLNLTLLIANLELIGVSFSGRSQVISIVSLCISLPVLYPAGFQYTKGTATRLVSQLELGGELAVVVEPTNDPWTQPFGDGGEQFVVLPQQTSRPKQPQHELWVWHPKQV